MSGRLPAWIAEWLGVHVPSNADTTTWNLTSKWNWAPWVTLLLVFGSIIWTAYFYAREAGSAGRVYRALLILLRLAAIAILLVMLAQWALFLLLSSPPRIALVVDHSGSMSIVDRYDDPDFASRLNGRLATSGLKEPTRLNIAKLLLKADHNKVLQNLAQRYRLQTYAVAGSVKRLSESSTLTDLVRDIDLLSTEAPTSRATRIGDALMSLANVSQNGAPAAVILLSDGVVTEGTSLGDAAQNLRSAGVPLFAVGIGNPSAPRDVELAEVLVDDTVFIDDLISFQARVKATGMEGKVAKITLRREDTAQPVAEADVILPAKGKTVFVRLADRPETAGQKKYTIEILPPDDEIDKKNNRQSHFVSVRSEKVRVLFAQGYPNYEFRFLKALLERDRTVQLSTYLQDADPEYVGQDQTALRSFPATRDELLAYDVVIIGDMNLGLLPQGIWQNMQSLISERGGGLVFVAGSKFWSQQYHANVDIRALLPAKLDAAQEVDHAHGNLPVISVHPTSIGLQSPAFQLGDTPQASEQIWSRLAPLDWSYPVGELNLGTQVLADGLGKPVICLQYIGAGRVLFHAIDSTWRWRIGGGQSFYSRYWLQMIRFLARGKLGKGRGVELTTDRREYHRGETAQVRVRFLDSQLVSTADKVIVTIDSVGQARRRVPLQRNPVIGSVFEGTLPELADGQYEIVLVEPLLSGAPPAGQFYVQPPLGEFAKTELDRAALSAAAEQTRGEYYTIADARQLLTDLPTGRRVPAQSLPPVPIWNRWWLLCAFLSCITTEWILRKRKSMV